MFQTGGIPIVRRPPTRIVPSSGGTISLAAGQPNAVPFLGVSGRQDRLQIVITNLDPALPIKVQNLSNVNLLTVFPQTNITLETEADLQIANLNGQAVSVEVMEIYVDAGGVPKGAVSLAIAGVAGAPSGGGSSLSGGGGRTGGGRQTP